MRRAYFLLDLKWQEECGELDSWLWRREARKFLVEWHRQGIEVLSTYAEKSEESWLTIVWVKKSWVDTEYSFQRETDWFHLSFPFLCFLFFLFWSGFILPTMKGKNEWTQCGGSVTVGGLVWNYIDFMSRKVFMGELYWDFATEAKSTR